MKRAYLAGKLNADNAVDYITNVGKMIKMSRKIRKEGYAVLTPCLEILTGIVFPDMTYEDYFSNSAEWIKVADVLFVMPDSNESKGTQKEIKIATKHNIPIIYL